MKRLAVLAVSLAACLPISARAAVAIVAVPGSYTVTYATPVVAYAGVAPLNFVNADIQEHDVVSDDTRAPGSAPWCPAHGPRCPLFFAPSAATGQTTVVQGLEGVPTGTYLFRCTPHAWMTATLVVARPAG